MKYLCRKADAEGMAIARHSQHPPVGASSLNLRFSSLFQSPAVEVYVPYAEAGITMKNELQYYMHDGSSAFRFELAGDLNSEGAHRLERDWHTASSVIGHRNLIVNMTFVTSADEEGRALLARWHSDGAQLVAKSQGSRRLAEAITGAPLLEFASVARASSDQTWLPFRTSVGAAALYVIVLLGVLLFPGRVQAANLKADTVAAWDDYVQSTTASMENRLRPGNSFLWTFETPERQAQVHKGEIVVAPVSGQNPRKVTGGLIHHWTGAAFLAGAKLDDVLEITRDYDHYPDYYKPSVIDARTIDRDALDDRFSMRLMNKAFFLKTALDADYRATNVRVDACRFYSVARSTRVQEIESYGQRGERKLPEGEGGGYIWKLFSIVRLEQRDGGVYLELETVALSREIPAVAHLVVDPIVRRVSRNSMLTSIQQTGEAVRWNSLLARQPADVSANGRQMGMAPAASSNKTAVVARVQ
jgi:hypothetical protein